MKSLSARINSRPTDVKSGSPRVSPRPIDIKLGLPLGKSIAADIKPFMLRCKSMAALMDLSMSRVDFGHTRCQLATGPGQVVVGRHQVVRTPCHSY